MRAVLGLLALLCAAEALPVDQEAAKSKNVVSSLGDLESLLQDFLKQVNFDAMVALWKQKEAAADADLMQVIDYLKSDDFKALYDYMHATADGNNFPDFLDYLRAGGLDIDAFEKWLAEELGWNSAPAGRHGRQLGDFKSLVDEFLALVDQQSVIAWALQQLASNPDMQALVAELEKPEAAATADYLEKSPEYQALLQFMRDDNIDIDSIIAAIRAALGWDSVSAVRAGLGDLESLLQDFLKQVNFDAMVALWKQKEAAADADLMQVIDYLKSDDFKALYDYMHATADGNNFPDFLDYLRAGGLDIDGFEKWLAEELGWNSAPAGRHGRQLGDFKSLVDEFLALVDQQSVIAWALQQLASNPDMQGLVAELEKPEAAATADYLEKSPEYQALLQFMRDDNIDIDSIIAAIKAALGWDSVSAVRAGLGDLESLLQDFLKQVNFDAMVALWKQKEAAADADLMQVIDYLKSDDFKALYDYMHATADGNNFPDFLDYLRAGGLDIDAFEKWLAEELGWNSAPAGRHGRQLGDFKSLADEFLALVDQQSVIAWALQQLASNPDMQGLVAELEKPEAAATADYLEKSPEYQALLQFMRDDNIDIDSIIAAIKAALGWDSVSAVRAGLGDLESLLQDFLKQVNFDAMVALWKQKEAAADADLMEVIDYLKSDDFKALYDYMHATADGNNFPDFLDYLRAGGLDIDGFEKWLAEELGWNSAPAGRHGRQLGDFKSLADEFLALVDQQSVIAWALQQLASNPDMQGLVAELEKPEAAATADYLEKSPEYQALLQFMRDDNIDIDSIIAAIRAALGWN
ncbi:uncharacterized protein LOC119103367 [Pollicipes pollicipes]|uniref:uncharacterized protein LOC119103367 n=1 Tax=Pollicipes pollicipes TaxID=41117 RepID=UPI001884A6C6|nr:uncharacterized protein LOC119103367 [Pollicipes pollicipes]